MQALRLALCCLLGLAVPALAQQVITPDQPVMGSSGSGDQPQPGQTQEGQPAADEQKSVQDVLVLGDALGGGLGAGFSRLGDASGRYDVAIRFNEESGLARPEVYDWPGTVPKILESNVYDIIVVMIGANDSQMIRSGNERFAFNSAGWVKAYEAQVNRLIDALLPAGARIIWVAPPPMQEADYDAAIKTVTAIQRRVVENRGVQFVDLRPQLTTPDGDYTDIGKDETGNVRKLRGSDGVSFFKAGNNRMAQLVIATIESGAPPPPAQVSGGDESAGAAPANARAVPVFGQSLWLGEVATVAPDDVRANAVTVAGQGLAPQASLEAIRNLAAPGSAAEKLFRLGDAGPAPQGRADDFTAPPLASPE
jgi:uncharacterized protein